MDDIISVPIFVESRYKVNRKRIKETVVRVLKEHGLKRSAEVSIAIVGDRKMKSLNKQYRNLDKTTNVLSFSQLEGDKKIPMLPVAPPVSQDLKNVGQSILLGDVVISFPQIIKEASEQDVLVDDKISMLVEHGVRHLLGEQH